MSKFDKLFEARENIEDVEDTASAKKNKNAFKPSVKTKSKKSVNPSNSGSKNIIKDPERADINESKKRGRPKAKRSDPDFIGFTTYIRKDTHLKVKIALLQEGGKRELSELVEQLLSNWVRNK